MNPSTPCSRCSPSKTPSSSAPSSRRATATWRARLKSSSQCRDETTARGTSPRGRSGCHRTAGDRLRRPGTPVDAEGTTRDANARDSNDKTTRACACSRVQFHFRSTARRRRVDGVETAKRDANDGWNIVSLNDIRGCAFPPSRGTAGGDTMRVGRSGARMRKAGWGGLFGFLDFTRPRLNDDDDE